MWVVVDRDESRATDCWVCGLWYFFEEEQPQLVYALLPEATQKGYATEASLKILEYCFHELGYEYLVASCDRPNVESLKLAQRLGMSEVAQRHIDDKPVVFFKIENNLVSST